MSRLAPTAWALVTMWPSGETTKPEATLRWARAASAETGTARPAGGTTPPRSASSGSATNGVANDTDVMLTTTAFSAAGWRGEIGRGLRIRGSGQQHQARADRQLNDSSVGFLLRTTRSSH